MMTVVVASAGQVRGRLLRLDGLWEQTSPLFLLTAAYVAGTILLGGGTIGGFLSDAFLQLAAIPLLLWSAWRLFGRPVTRQMRLALMFCGALVFLFVLQLLPLPPWLWTLLPNREISADAYKALGTTLPWMPLSVAPQASWLSALSLLPPLAIFLAVLQCSYPERRFLSALLIALAVVSVFVGLVQVAQGEQSTWRFFAYTNKTEAVGFFANRNHFSALIYTIIPLAAAWTINSVSELEARIEQGQYDIGPIVGTLAGFTVLVILLAGEIMARSRMGLALSIIALFGALVLGFIRGKLSFNSLPNRDWWRTAPRQLWSGFTAKVLLAAIALVVTFSFQFAFFRMQERFSADVGEDARTVFVPIAAKAAKAYMPFGAGSGTFVSVYPLFERPKDTFAELYANRAHNDLVELWLETGVFGLILVALFTTWWALRAKQIWTSARPSGASQLDWLLMRAATISIPLILVHSFFDYPLRTSAMAAVMAILSVFLIEPFPRAVREERFEPDEIPEPRRRKRSSPAPVAPPVYASEPPGTFAPAPAQPPVYAPPAPVTGTEQTSNEDRRWGTDINWPKEWTKSDQNSSAQSEQRPGATKPPGRPPWR